MSKIGISLGWNCGPATYGANNGLREIKANGYQTCPFDEMVSNLPGVIECIKDDFKYITDDKNLYGIRIVFQKKIIENLNKKYNNDVLEFLKPKYPWNRNVLEENKLENYLIKTHLEYIKEKIENNENKEKIIEYINNLIKK